MSCTLATAARHKAVACLHSEIVQGIHRMAPAIAGVEGEDLNLTAESAYFMGQAFTDMIEKQLGKAPDQLRISVRALYRHTPHHPTPRSGIHGLTSCMVAISG